MRCKAGDDAAVDSFCFDSCLPSVFFRFIIIKHAWSWCATCSEKKNLIVRSFVFEFRCEPSPRASDALSSCLCSYYVPVANGGAENRCKAYRCLRCCHMPARKATGKAPQSSSMSQCLLSLAQKGPPAMHIPPLEVLVLLRASSCTVPNLVNFELQDVIITPCVQASRPIPQICRLCIQHDLRDGHSSIPQTHTIHTSKSS